MNLSPVTCDSDFKWVFRICVTITGVPLIKINVWETYILGPIFSMPM
jgi:hypothetical protein